MLTTTTFKPSLLFRSYSPVQIDAFKPLFRRQMMEEEKRQILDSFLAPLAIESRTVAQLSQDLSLVFKDLARNSTEQFLATPVSVLPHGSERGRFIAIDVGGSNLRVGLIELLGKSTTPDKNIRKTYERSWSIDDHMKMDRGEELFAWIGDCIAQVVAQCVSDLAELENDAFPLGEVVPLGITFSFPMIQQSISEATLMTMGKGFAIKSEVDLAKMLLEGYSRHLRRQSLIAGMSNQPQQLPDIKIAAITNDTVATMASLAYSVRSEPHSRVAMGLIVGTGTNATINMKLKELHAAKRESIRLPTNTDLQEACVAVNTEWTINGSAGPLKELGLKTRWDTELDGECEAPGFQPYEYMTGGRYLGELSRIILFDYMVNILHIQPFELPEAFCVRNAVSTTYLSRTVAPARSAATLQPELARAFPPHPNSGFVWTRHLTAAFMIIAEALQKRSARIVAAATVALLVCADELKWKGAGGYSPTREKLDELVVAYAGGVIQQYPGFLETCQSTIDELVRVHTNRDKVGRVALRETTNGGIIGAGVLAGTVWNLPR